MRLSGRLICADAAQAATIRRHLDDHLRLSRAEPGCLAFEVWQTADPLVWRVEERFASVDAFEAHQRRTRASEWWAATEGIAREYAVTEG
ncbi:MAG: putative quinol monooxygenase [Alkalilacustris sp.]